MSLGEKKRGLRCTLVEFSARFYRCSQVFFQMIDGSVGVSRCVAHAAQSYEVNRTGWNKSNKVISLLCDTYPSLGLKLRTRLRPIVRKALWGAEG